MTDDEPKRPDSIEIRITDTQQVVINFDHGDIPLIVLSQQGAEQVGSHIASAANRVSSGFDPSDKYVKGAGE